MRRLVMWLVAVGVTASLSLAGCGLCGLGGGEEKASTKTPAKAGTAAKASTAAKAEKK